MNALGAVCGLIALMLFVLVFGMLLVVLVEWLFDMDVK